ENVEQLIRLEEKSVDLIIDGTDNVETRYLINDAAVKHSVPWVYGACVGTEGRVMSIRPGATAGLRGVFPEPPGPGEMPTWDTAGVLGPVAAIVASLQVIAAIKLLIEASAGAELIRIDGWNSSLRRVQTVEKRADCPTCSLQRFEFLDSAAGGDVRLCGRDAV